ncbi:MAG: hypothetical protein ACK5UX_12855 [Burkholderiales bacterium]
MKSRPLRGTAGTIQREPAAQTAARARQAARIGGTPPDAVLRQALAACITTRKGSSREAAAAVYEALAVFVEDAGHRGAELLTWIKNKGTSRMDAANHTAATATWHDGTYVIDTSCGQVGAADFFLGSVSDWRQHIIGLAGNAHRISRVVSQSAGKPFDSMEMWQIALALKEQATPRAKKRFMPRPPSGPPPTNGPSANPPKPGSERVAAEHTQPAVGPLSIDREHH